MGVLIDARIDFQIRREIAEFDRENGPPSAEELKQVAEELAGLEVQDRINRRRKRLGLPPV